MQIAEAKVRRGDIEYTIPVDMNKDVGIQIKQAMLTIQDRRPQGMIKFLKDSVEEMRRAFMSDEELLEGSCGTWLCNSCEDTGEA